MTSETSPHAIVIGAGIVGVSCAAHLQAEGFRVTVVDRVPPGQGCSFGNAGAVGASSVMPTVHSGIVFNLPKWLFDPTGPLKIRLGHLPKALPWFMHMARNALPDRVRAITEARAALCLRTLADHEQLLADAGASDLLIKTDGITIYPSEASYRADAHVRDVREQYGYQCRRLSPGEVHELEPDITRDIVCGSTSGGMYRVVNPATVVERIADHVRSRGGEVLTDEVVSIAHDGNKALEVTLKTDGVRTVDRLVIAAGAYSGELAGMLGDKVLLEAERGYHLTIPDPGVSLGRSVYYATYPGLLTPMDVGLRIGGTDEFAGLDASPDWRRADHLWGIAKKIVPGLRDLDDNVSRWMGRRPGTPDSLPVISPASKLHNVWYAFGHSHWGLTWGPTTGRLIAEMMAGRPSNIELDAYRIDRF